MLLERQMKRSKSASKARLQVLYVISAICRKSKRKFGEKDKYGKQDGRTAFEWTCADSGPNNLALE